VFVPTGNASTDHTNIVRGERDYYAASVVALDADTGEMRWHFQTVHRDHWDYDLPSQPVLFPLRRDGKDIPALAQSTKQGHIFILNRETGEPLFPVEERPVTQMGGIAGERYFELTSGGKADDRVITGPFTSVRGLPDGATVKRPDGTEVYVDSDEVKNYLIKADDVLTTYAPARQQWLAQRQPAVEAAKNLFPDIFTKGTALNTAYQATVKQAPELLKLPQVEYWVGLALYGEQQLMQKQEAQKAKASAAKGPA
jgi:hypothetical protein